MSKWKKGQQFGKWTLEVVLGKGGNAEVWRVCSESADSFAMKNLGKSKASAQQRFTDEESILSSNQDIPGLLPVIDKYLPSAPTVDDPAWFVMPLAKPLKSTFGRDKNRVVSAVVDLGETLCQLHDRGVSHRDIKPDNLLFWENRARLSDFGIADFPDKPDLTGVGQMLGPYWTIA